MVRVQMAIFLLLHGMHLTGQHTRVCHASTTIRLSPCTRCCSAPELPTCMKCAKSRSSACFTTCTCPALQLCIILLQLKEPVKTCACVFIIQSTGSHRFLWDKLMLCSGDCFVNTSQLQFCQMREKSEYSLKPDLKTYEVKVNDLVRCHGILKDLMGIDHITY